MLFFPEQDFAEVLFGGFSGGIKFLDIHLKSQEDSRKLGAVIASCIHSSLVIGLIGKLGAGKTTLTQGLAEELGVEEEVSSPTFLMLNEYQSGSIPIYHFDLYRLQEDLNAGSAATTALRAELQEIMHSHELAVALVEWLDLYDEFCSGMDVLYVRIDYQDEGRLAKLSASGSGAESLLTEISHQYSKLNMQN